MYIYMLEVDNDMYSVGHTQSHHHLPFNVS